MSPSPRHDWNPFLRFPAVSLALTALLAVPLLVRLARFSVSAEVQALLAGDQRSLASYRQVREILGDTEAVVLSLTLTNLFSPDGLERVRAISDAFEREPDVVEVKSLTHAVRPVRRGLGFEMVPLVPPPPWDAPELAEVRDFCLSHPLARNLLVSADGQHTLITVHFRERAVTAEAQQRFRERLGAVLAPFDRPGSGLRVMALPLIEDEIRATLRRDLAWFLPAAAGVIVLVLWLTFHSVRLVGFTLCNQLAVLALLPGVIQLAGVKLSVFSISLAPLVTGIHLTLMMHLLTAVQRACAENREVGEGLRVALRVVTRPALWSTLTTVLGLLSLGSSQLESVRQFGWLGALCLATVHAYTFGPTLALLQLGGRRLGLGSACGPKSTRGGDEVGGAAVPACSVPLPGNLARQQPRPTGNGPLTECSRTLAASPLPDFMTAFVTRHRRGILIAAGVVALVAAVGLAQLRTDVRIMEMLPPDSRTRQALEEFDEVYGGINVVQITLDSGRADGINDPAFLRFLDEVHRFAAAQREPTGVFSYAQLLAMVNQIWEGGRPEALRLPVNPLLVGLFVTAIRTYDFPFLTALADPAFREAQLVVRTRDMPAREYLGLIHRIVAFAERRCPPGANVSAARGIHEVLEADRRIVHSQCSSVGWALGVIALALALFWRSVRLALLGMVTNSVPVGLALAIAGYAGVPLNSINLMVGALALGIAQDDTVHFITHWRERIRAGDSCGAALCDTFAVKGRPIIWTTVILVGVFALFGLSSFPPVVQFGLLLAGAFVAAQVSVLLFLPACLAGRREPA